MVETNISTKRDSHEVHKSFIVRSPSSPRTKTKNVGHMMMDSFSILTVALFLFLVDQGHTNLGSSFSSWSYSFPYRFGIVFSCLVILIATLMDLLRRFWRSNLKEHNMCKVEVMPLGLQITEAVVGTHKSNNRPDSSSSDTSTSDQQWHTLKQTKSQFLPLTDIVDVIISEVVLGYKVITCVMFRIQSNSTSSSNQQEIDTTPTIQKRCIALVPAFSPDQVQMSYEECEQMWAGLMKALNLPLCTHKSVTK